MQRVERIHRKGGGFEAAGTLGRSQSHVKPVRRSYLRSALLVAGSFLLIKSLLLMQIGATDYQDRVARLKTGGYVERAGAYVMQMDPVTVWVAEKLREILKGS
ncbi:hypothetical protein [Actibacterium ureilyticum]|uniref:hypothetical protein n=1 Tax=Actibacterium ureilyticum TaxID=1590614 RepID=UPI000BAAE60A|nr:hypothetical protein [Actibacterium ureilyticum]